MRSLSIGAAVLFAAVGLATSTFANTQHPTPNVVNKSTPTTSFLNGSKFVNKGLVGMGRMPGFLDAQGSTFGSVSSLAITPGSWSYDAASGGYSGQFLTLPDRGRNDPATGNFVNYQGRIQKVDFTFNPLFNGDGSSQDQIQLSYKGLTLLAEANGAPTVGNDPGAEFGTAFNRNVPRSNGNIALDAEGLVARNDGSYYVSDEYGSAIYHFDNSGTLQGVINPPDALAPVNAMGDPFYSSVSNPTTGRRPNQGMEGLTLTPDGRYLIAMNQSGAMQDSAGSQASRRFTRVLVYDLQNEATPENPIGHYVMELPTFRSNGDGSAVDRTAAQSEIVALSESQFLVLARDGNGRGPGTGLAPAYKSAILADITGATNLVNTNFNGVTPISPGGILDASITTVSQVEAVNMLNLFDLGRFNLNLDVNAQAPNGDENTLSEKWEGFALVEDLATDDPHDYFLFVANDNDFLSTNGVMHTTDGQTINYSDPIDNDTMFLAYSIRYVPTPGAGALAALGLAFAARRRR